VACRAHARLGRLPTARRTSVFRGRGTCSSIGTPNGPRRGLGLHPLRHGGHRLRTSSATSRATAFPRTRRPGTTRA
jgi:hypothetical protein